MSNIIKSSRVSFKGNTPLLLKNEDIMQESESEQISDSSLDLNEENKTEQLETIEEKIIKIKEELVHLEEKKASLSQEVEMERQQIFDKAKEEGYNLGYGTGVQEAASEYAQKKKDLEAEWAKKLDELQKQWLEILKQGKEAVKDTVIQILRYLFLEDAIIHTKLIEVLALKGLSEITEEKKIKVMLSEGDYEKIDKMKLGIALENGKELTVVSDRGLKEGDCVIETELGYVDCGIDECLKVMDLFIDKHTDI